MPSAPLCCIKHMTDYSKGRTDRFGPTRPQHDCYGAQHGCSNPASRSQQPKVPALLQAIFPLYLASSLHNGWLLGCGAIPPFSLFSMGCEPSEPVCAVSCEVERCIGAVLELLAGCAFGGPHACCFLPQCWQTKSREENWLWPVGTQPLNVKIFYEMEPL